jgi:multiple sugar transport system substrate-binding protein
MSRRLAMLCSAAMAGSAMVAACGGGDDSGGGAATGGATGATKGAKVINVNAMKGAKGDVTFCTGKDTSGDRKALIKQFNQQNPSVNAKMLEFSTSADEQRNQFVQRQEAKSGECDIFYADVIWTAEFASQKWLYDMTPYVSKEQSELIPATVKSVRYDGKLWGMPNETNAPFLYYRTDQVKKPPTTWQQTYQLAKANDGIVYQGAPYEGLTCDFLDISVAAGGSVISPDGKKATIDSPQNLKALQLMVDGVKQGVAAKGVTTYMEEESRRYWESGRATFMRNWPYAYALGQEGTSKVKGKFDVMPLPRFAGAGTGGTLGGHNLVISVYSKNPGAALKLIDFFSSRNAQKIMLLKYTRVPANASVYDDPQIQRKYKFATQLKQGISQAAPRPVSPVYPQISQAIYENVNAALSGKISPEDALKTAQQQIDKALQTF